MYGGLIVSVFILVMGVVMYFTSGMIRANNEKLQAQTESSSTTVSSEPLSFEETNPKKARLDVDLLNQMDAPRLRNGCEVTSLAMLLNYFDVEVTKNELADELPSISYQDEQGYYGDPNEAFVGNVYGNGSGYFVYHDPIYDLAVEYVSKDLKAIDLTGCEFPEVQHYLANGSPVWVITTTIYDETNDIAIWETKNGDVEISMSEHSVLLVGYDKDYVYLNDPYGNKDYQTDLDNFVESWEQMGNQAITVVEKDADFI